MICKHCGREVVKSPHHFHPNGYMHSEVPKWNCGRGNYNGWSKEVAEPFDFKDYLNQIENEKETN